MHSGCNLSPSDSALTLDHCALALLLPARTEPSAVPSGMSASDGEAAPPTAPAYYRGRALPVQPVGTTAAATAATAATADSDTDPSPVSAHLFSSRCHVRQSVDDEWNRRRASTQAHVDATLRRARYAVPPPAAAAAPPFASAIVAASSPVVAPRPQQPPTPSALEGGPFSSHLSTRPGQPLPYSQTLWAGSYSSRPASAARLASRAPSPSPSVRAPRPASASRHITIPTAMAAQDIYRKPAQALASASSIPSSQANSRRPASASPAGPPAHPHHGAAAPVRPASARATAPQASRFAGVNLGQVTSRAHAYDVSSSVAAAVAPLRPSSAVRAAEAQRRSSARLTAPSPPRSATPASAASVTVPPASAPNRRPVSARSSSSSSHAHRDTGGGWQRPHTAHSSRRTPVLPRDESPTPGRPLAARDETTTPAHASDVHAHSIHESFPVSQLALVARNVGDSSPPIRPSSATASVDVTEQSLTARAASPAAAAPSYFVPSAVSTAIPPMSLRLPPPHTTSAASTARQRHDAASSSSRAVSTERAAGGGGGGGGRLHTGSTVPSAANTARGSTSRRGSGTTRSTASSLWPPSTIPSARFGAPDYAYSAEDSQQAHPHTHPLSALSGPSAPVLPSGEGPRALLESLRDDLHRLCKQNDIEGALLCVQKLQLYRWRHSEGRGDQLAVQHTDEATDEYTTDSADDSLVASESAPIWDVRLLCDRSGSTPLFHASWLCLLPLARLLLSSGLCPVSHRNVRGNSALDMAIERSHLPMVRLLLAHGAKLSSASPHFLGLGADASAAAIAAARVDVNADPGPASGPADLRRLEALGARATYEIAPRVQSLLRTRAATPHKALKMAYYARSGAAARLEALFESNPRSAARWAQELCAGGLSALGLAARFGHARVAHLLLDRGGVDVHAECAVRDDGRMLEEGDDDDDDDNEDNEKQKDNDSENDSDDDSASDIDREHGPSARRSKRTRTTNAFALAVEHGHYLLALELHERWGARIDHSTEVRAAVASAGARVGAGAHDAENHLSAAITPSSLVRSSLLLMQRMATLSLSLQQRLLESWQQSRGSESGATTQLDSVRSWLETECGPGAEGARLRAAVLAYPDRHGRCALHVAVALEMPAVLDYLLEQGGFRDAAAASKRAAADAGAAGLASASSPSDPLSSSREHLRHLTLLQLAGETNNLTLVYLLLSHGGRLSLPDAIRALDRKAHPHSRLDESNGLLLISYAMEQQRNDAREERARRDHAHALACAVALARGHPPPPLPPLRCAVMSPDELVALLNSTSIGVDLAQRILQTLLPSMAADAAESGSAPISRDVSVYLRRLHAWQLAQGRAVLSPEDEVAAAASGAGGLSSGYGRASTGLLSARGSQSQKQQRKKNRLHDASYLARLLARQRAHAARHALLWSEAQGSPEEQRAEAADRSALRRMEGAMLTPRRIQQLMRLHAELVAARADSVPLPPTEADLLAAEHERVEGLHRDDMMGERAERHRAQVRAAKTAARAAAEAALAPQPAAGVDLTASGSVDWVALSRRPSSTLASSSAPAGEHPEALRARLCFQMDELLTYNSRLRLGLGVGPGGGAGGGESSDGGASALVPSPIPGSGMVGQRFASRRHTAQSWVRAWQEQAWDEGLHSIDVLLREYGRRRDRKGVRRADWVPLGFLWPNRYSQEQAVRSAARRSARSIRVAERQARRARLVAGKDSAAATAASAAISAAMAAQAGGASATSDFLQGGVGQLLLGAHFDAGAAGGSTAGAGGGGGGGDGSPGSASHPLDGPDGSSVSPEAAALALRMREELAAQFGCDVSPWSSQSQSQSQSQWPPPQSASARSPSRARAQRGDERDPSSDGGGIGGTGISGRGGGVGGSPPVPLPLLDSLLASNSRSSAAPPAAPLLYSPRLLAMAQAAEVIGRQQAVMRITEVDAPAWVRSR